MSGTHQGVKLGMPVFGPFGVSNGPKNNIVVFVLVFIVHQTEITNFWVILQNFHFLGLFGPFWGQKGPKFDFFEHTSVCTRFSLVFRADHEFLGHCAKFSFLGHFWALFEGQKGPKIDFFEHSSVCTLF